MLNDEIINLKSLMVNIEGDINLIVCLQYHTERLPGGDNSSGKFDRSKSMYRWIARVTTRQAIEDCINNLYKEENMNEKFKWPDEPDGYYLNCKYSRAYEVASWLETKLKKIKSWKDGLKVFAGYESKTKNRKGGINEKAKYKTEGYAAPDGTIVSLTDKDELLKHVGQNLILYVKNLK